MLYSDALLALAGPPWRDCRARNLVNSMVFRYPAQSCQISEGFLKMPEPLRLLDRPGACGAAALKAACTGDVGD
eukprot:1019741-Pyramimonas_sp.AAC.1